MKCEKCDSRRVHWRCDNFETKQKKFKCKNCGHIIIKNMNEEEMLIKKPKKLAKNFYANQGGFEIRKNIHGKREYFGRVKTREQAVEMVKQLNKVNWDKSKLSQLKKEICGI